MFKAVNIKWDFSNEEWDDTVYGNFGKTAK